MIEYLIRLPHNTKMVLGFSALALVFAAMCYVGLYSEHVRTYTATCTENYVDAHWVPKYAAQGQMLVYSKFTQGPDRAGQYVLDREYTFRVTRNFVGVFHTEIVQ